MRDLKLTRGISSVLLCLLAFAALLPTAPALAGDYEAQIWNGDRVAEGEHRAVALLDFRFDPHVGGCSGTLVSPRWVLTAAHCVDDRPGQRVTIRLGGVDVDRGFDEVWTTRVHETHRRWRPARGQNDFALLKLPGKSSIEPVQLATYNDEAAWQPGTQANIVGWGAVDGADRGTGRLREGFTILARDGRCDDRYAFYDIYSMLCARAIESDACRGDSGGPLYVNSNNRVVQMGVTSFGRDCDVARYAVYAFVPGGRAWIRNTQERGIPKIVSWAGIAADRRTIPRGGRARFDAGLLRDSDGRGLGDQMIQLVRRRGPNDTWRVVDTARTGRYGFARLQDDPHRTFRYAVRHGGSIATRRAQSFAVTVEVGR